jgi:hypothetical protein
MKITKQRLKEIIKEEISTVRESDWYDPKRGYETRADMEYATRNDIGLGDLQSDEQFTGGTPEEQMLTRIKARDLLAAMSKEELKELSLSLDAETVAELRHLLTNPMYQPGLEEYRSTGTGGQSAKDREKPARPSSDTRSSNRNYRG